MTGRRLVLLRHGRTAFNHAKRVQGHLDVELDDVGHDQASAVAPVLAGFGPVALWCSDLVRARQTAAYVAKETGIEPSFDPRLREYHLGERQGITHDEYAAAHPEEYVEFRQAHYDVVPGAEKTPDVAARMAEVLRRVIAGLAAGETAVVVSHGAAIRIVLPELLGWPRDAAEALRGLDNCGWAELVEDPHTDRMRLAAYNRVVGAGGDPDFASAVASG